MDIVSIKQQQKEVLISTKKVQDAIKYLCGQCKRQATTKERLNQHKRAVHKVKKYSCGQCQHQSTSNGDLTKLRRVTHEGLKHPCG